MEYSIIWHIRGTHVLNVAYVCNDGMCLYHRSCASDLGAYDAQALRVTEQMAEAHIT